MYSIKYSLSLDLLTQQAVPCKSEIKEARKPLPFYAAVEWRLMKYQLGGGPETSTHNKRGCAIFTRKVVAENPGTYLKLIPKIREPETLGFPSKGGNLPPG